MPKGTRSYRQDDGRYFPGKSVDLQVQIMLPVVGIGDRVSVSDLIVLLLFEPAKATVIKPLLTVTEET
jgi:hypothetical protein